MAASANVVSLSDFKKVVIVDQVKALEAVKEKSERVEAAQQSKIQDEQKKTNDVLVENIKDLSKAIKENVRIAIQNGLGQKVGSGLVEKEKNLETGNRGSLRKFLIGDVKGAEEVKKKSWMQKIEDVSGGRLKVGKYSLTGMIDRRLTQREEKQATEAEKKEYVKNAMAFDFANKKNKGETGGVANLKNLNPEAAKKKAEEEFDKIKAQQKEVTKVQKEVDAAKASGFGPSKALLARRDAASAQLAEIDPRLRRNLVEPAKADKVTAVQPEAANSSTFFSKSSEEKEEGDAERKKYEADSVTAETSMGATLIASLEVQKQMLEAFKAGGTGGGASSGGGMLDTIGDLASNVGKRGLGMASKAAGFIGKHAGKLGAIGGIAMGTYDAYTGWNQANEDIASGKITEDEGDVKKGEAVGGGVGGAAGAWGGAAAGAAIGSVVPIVGTAVGGIVGGALGYMGGSAIGSKVGGALTEGYQGVKSFLGFGGDKDKQVSATQENISAKWNDGKPTINGKEVSQEEYYKTIGTEDSPVRVEPVKSNAGEIVSSKSADSAEARDNMAKSSNNVVNAPTTTISNSNSQNNTIRSPIRHEEGSLNRYVTQRYAPF